MPLTALLATASGLHGPWPWIARLDPGSAHRLADQHGTGLDVAGDGPAAPAGQGIRLEAGDGRSLELAELRDGFGVLRDALLQRGPAGLRVDPEALQRSYARWFEGEEAEPPEGMGPAECVLAMGRAFGARLLWHHSSSLPFEARWTVDGRPRISHGGPHGNDPGYASFRLEGREVVMTSDAGTVRESLDPSPAGPHGA